MAMRCRVLRPRTRLQGVMVGLVLATFLTSDLLLRAGIESNPGPTEGRENSGRTVQTRLTAAAGTRSASCGGERRGSAGHHPHPQDPSLGDVMAKLSSMQSSINDQFDQVRGDFQHMRAEVISLQEEVQDYKERVEGLERENGDIKETNEMLLERVSRLEGQVDDLEGRSRRNNIIVHGLDKREGESGEDLEAQLQELFTDTLELAEDVPMDRVHRLGSKPNAPIIARCTYFKDKVTVMKNKSKLQGSEVFIGEDFSRGVRQKRKLLSPFLKAMREGNKKASLVHDHIVQDGRKFFLSADGKSVVERK